MKKLRGIIFLLAFVFILSLTSVVGQNVEELADVKAGDCAYLQQTCSVCSFVNLEAVTVKGSPATYLNLTMTKRGNTFNYSFCNTSTLGEYVASTCGNPYGNATCVNYNFKVTSGGTTPTGNNSFVIVFVLIVFAVLFVYIGSIIDSNKWVVKSCFYFVALLLMLINIAVCIQITDSNNLSTLMTSALVIGIATFSMFIAYIFINYFVQLVRAIKAKKKEDSEFI